MAEVGFPSPGNLKVVYKMKGQSTFVPFESDRIIQYDTNTTNTSCVTTKYFKFGLNFTSADEGGEVKCVATNQELGVITDSAVGTLELIPKQYCNTTDAPKYLHHPTNCNKYVQCVGRYPYGNQCPNADQCADITTDIVVCKSCEGVVCPWNITTTTPGPTTTTLPPPSSQTTTTTPTTTTLPPDVYATCNSVNSLIGSSATVTCSVNKDTYSYINVTFTARVTQTSNHVVDIIPGTGAVNDNNGADRSVTVTNGGKEIDITFTSLSCTNEGTFHIKVFAGSEVSSTPASVSVR
ncbi:integumentary mucin C.1-like, partial [Pecten maximus]|uniref:integumentary mucin C.1-like n=1 Tax=Pecten maximus TaxID=6579 RepID=UPI00145838CD